MTNALNFHSRKAMVGSGILGFSGAAIMLAGDLFLYAHWDQMPSVKSAILDILPARKSILLAVPEHLLLSGLSGPIATIFYLFGGLHIYLCLYTFSKFWAVIAGGLFAIGVIFSGVFHTLWSLYGMIVQYSNAQKVVPLNVLQPAQDFMIQMNTAVAIPIGLAVLVLAVRILLNKSEHPRWLAVFTPIFALAIGPPILDPIAATLPTPYGAFLTGAYYNMVMLVFFFASTSFLYLGRSK